MVKDPKTKMKIRTEKKEMTKWTKKAIEERLRQKEETLYKMKSQGLI